MNGNKKSAEKPFECESVGKHYQFLYYYFKLRFMLTVLLLFFGFDPGSKQAFTSRHSAKYFLSLIPLIPLQSVVAAWACARAGAHPSTACLRVEASVLFLRAGELDPFLHFFFLFHLCGRK